MLHTIDQPHHEERGVNFELDLGDLTGLVNS